MIFKVATQYTLLILFCLRSIISMNKYTSHSLEETAQISREWLRLISEKKIAAQKSTLETGHNNGATIIGLSGNLGAGKTAFTKCVAKELGIDEDVTSPTFVIMKIYSIGLSKSFPWKKLIHIDAYRLERGEELTVLGFEQLAKDADNLILIEWPENVKGALERYEGYSVINFSVGENDTERVVVFR